MSELKSYVNRVLGNSLRCLLPSYWWKRLFGLVVDRIDEVEQSAAELAEAAKMPIVESEDELSKLDLPKGSIASVRKVGESVTVKMSDCYFSNQLEADWEKYTIVKYVEEVDNVTIDKDSTILLSASKEDAEKDSLYVATISGIFYYVRIVDGDFRISNLSKINEALSSGNYRAITNLGEPDQYFTFYSDTPQPSLYIKGGSWERLVKERDLEDVGGGIANANSVEIRELHISQLIENDTIIQENQLTDEQKAYNLETLELARQNKAIASVSILNARFLLYEYSGKDFVGSVLINTSHILELYVMASIDDQGNGLMKLLTGHKDDELSETSENAVQNRVVTAALKNKVDKVDGKQLSTEDFTSRLKAKLDGLSNYDDTSIKDAINSLTTQINTLVSGDASVAIESFDEIIAFLNGIEDSESLDSIIAAIEQQIAGKQNTIDDLADIRAGAALGKTALQSVPAGYVTSDMLRQEITNVENQITGVYTTIPQRTSQLNNDSGFTTEEYVNTQVRTAIISALNTEV